MRFTFGLLCLAALGAPSMACATTDEWPASPERATLETPYGTLAVRNSDYLYGATLTFNRTPTIPRLEGILNIPYAYKVGNKQMALVSQDKGSADCPVTYYWVVISRQGYRITEPFGSCSADIRLDARGQQLRMETPDPTRSGQLDVWEFNGEKIRKSTTRP